MKKILATLTAAFLLSACGSSAEDTPSKDTSVETTPEASSPAPTPIEDPVYALGDEVDLTVVKVTVLEYKKGISDGGSPPDNGLRLDGALLRVCNVSYEEDDSGSGHLTDPFAFSLVDGDDGSYDLYDLTPSPAPQPQFGDFKVLAAGKCTKGWMAFDLPQDAKPVKITYGPDNDEAAAWVLG